MIPEFGLFCLILSMILAISLTILSPIGLIEEKFAFLQNIAKPAVYGQCFFVILSFLTLMFCFVNNDFSVAYVAQNSNSHLPLIYKICAVWGAHEGSLLLWSLILTIWMAAVAFFSKQLPQDLATMVLTVLGAIQVGFLVLLLHTSNPFARILPFFPEDGSDLNPLLQDPGFILHPPFLYLGYVGFAVPFAFALAAMSLRKNIPWAMYARPWALMAWSFLTVGITLGSWWAYYELGWGGWWFWDPVENASFMPWLVGAALGHALMVSSRNPVFSSWSMVLAISAFLLSLMGTFLVRSGVISSVHAFASDPKRGVFILGFLAVVSACSFGLYIFRAKSNNKISTRILSKEALILLGNVIFFVAMLTVLLGTLYPLIIEVLQNAKISVGPPYFNSVFIPIMFPLLMLMAIAPYLQWGQGSFSQLLKKIRVFLFVFGVLALGIFYFRHTISPLSVVGVVLGSWVAIGTLFKSVSFLMAYRTFPLKQWGMFFAHLGIGFTVLGISLTTSLESEKEFKMGVKDIARIGQYEFLFNDLKDIHGSNYEGKQGHFIIKKNQQRIAELFPEKRFFIPRELPMTETAILPGLLRDFYIALGERFEDGSWSVRCYIKPFIRWIWLGGILVAVGAFLSGLVAFRQNFVLSHSHLSFGEN